jgi:hypothetical protein
MRALLRKRRVVDDQEGLVPAQHRIRLAHKLALQRCGVPHSGADEVMQLVVADAAIAQRHGLDAFALADADQARHIGRAHPRPRLVPQRDKKRRQPPLQLASPIRSHGRPSIKPTTHESPITPLGNPARNQSAKVVLAAAHEA